MSDSQEEMSAAPPEDEPTVSVPPDVFDRPTVPGPDTATLRALSAAEPAAPTSAGLAPALGEAGLAEPAPASGGAPSVEVSLDVEPEAESLPPASIIELVAKAPPPPPRRAGESIAPMSFVSSEAPHWPPRVVGDVMTRKVITMGEHEPVGDLDALMDRFHFHHLPIVTAGMKLVGLITPTDYLRARLGVGPGGEAMTPADASTPAREIMRRNLVTGTPDAPLATACKVMIQQRLGCFPIIRPDGALVGIVTPSDFVRLAYAFLDAAAR
ncbi:MAG: CBS domain-containing protein [Polyangiaceae bacterium]|nr:CBS domain-containing protein [Polyangiaceae bacterium]